MGLAEMMMKSPSPTRTSVSYTHLSAVNEVKTKAAAKQHHAAEELAAAQALAKKIEGKTVALKAKAGQGGRLFGSVTAKDIAEGLSKLVGEPVDKRKVVLDTDIRCV